ncbi:MULTISPECIES: PTS transporter subunit EIIC [unclassified Klebsiella]|uniref:PTS transporter subunit EIIC n=1 Tax=Enterobacteriaceae TaxID=543 RepID=UPI0015DC2EEC|nr:MULTISPECIES: PTS transporter subunit EIIC [unclassified Klebsiella]BBR57449.1 PTS sugar transporter subunit IIC [Klebsiella sp. WP4-W18-ESBL-05]BBS90186.1 PTS sugar transporter subunit IIC [Klebsiella sp. WP7-S18-CRE-02]BBS95208.1 PTS sugar transporter subunit IIC [Klebsiella sp. WP7-S18-CRE-03]BBT00240.1 PTS sugar transporter subunit IIC [Klebsiella sp. WP7-S18-ESBL-04]
MANKIEHLEHIADAIEKHIGGFDNVVTLTHCMTRVRVVLRDRGRFNAEALRKTDGVKGVVDAGEQFQIIVGAGTASKVTGILTKRLNHAGVTPAVDDNVRKPFSIRRSLNILAAIFVPTIPALIGCGLILGLVNVCRLIGPEFVASHQDLFALLTVMGKAVFTVLAVMIGMNTAKELQASPAIGAVMAAVLAAPDLANIKLFGSALTPGGGGIFAVLLVCVFAAKFELWFRRYCKESLDLILTPMVTILVSSLAALLILQPLAHAVNQWLGDLVALSLLNNSAGSVAVGALLGGGFLFLLLTGLHQGLIPIHAQILDTFGLNYLFPILAMGGMGQVGAAAYVYLKTKNPRLKKTISGALPVGIIGVGEPLLFGVSLPLGKPFIAGCIGGAAGGAVMAACKVGIIIPFGTAGLSLLPLVGAGQILPFLLAVLSAWIVGFIAAMILGFTDPQE